MATRTASVTGLASLTATWGGAAIPVDGDIIVCNTGITATMDYTLILGSKAGAVGNAMTINATNVSVFGKVIVSAGVTLTLRGFNSTNRVALINAFGEFAPQPGSTIKLGIPTEDSTWFVNNGVLTSVGTAGSHVTWTNDTAPTWSTAGGSATGAIPLAYYDKDNFICAYPFGVVGISNAAGTALGSFGDSSLSFASQSPGTILATPVASLALVNGTGKYFCDHEIGMLFFYHNTGTAFSYTPSYKKLVFVGVDIQSQANANGNQVIVRYSDFSYLGASNIGTGNGGLLDVRNKFSASGSLRDFQCTNNNFQFCKRPLCLLAITGTSGAKINVTDNTFYGYDGDAYGYCVGLYRTNSAHVNFERNRTRGVELTAGTAAPMIQAIGSGGVVASHANWSIRNNLIEASQAIEGGVPEQVVWPNLSGNLGFLRGFGSAYDTRQVTNLGGTSGNLAVIDGCVSWRGMRLFNLGSYETIKNSIFGHNYHHTINGPTSQNDIRITDVVVDKNLSMYAYDGGAFCEFGYNRRQWFDGPVQTSNTVYKNTGDPANRTGALTFGDQFDSGTQMISRLVMAGNVVNLCKQGVIRVADNAALNTRVHMTTVDYNAIQGSTTANYVTLFPRFSTWTGLTSVTGVSLSAPTYSSPPAAKALAFGVNSATDHTLAWDGGVAVQLIQFSGTLTSNGANGANQGTTPINATFTDTGKTFNTSLNNANCPGGMWVKFTSGTQSGNVHRITLNTATVCTIAPQYAGSAPLTGDTYNIYKAEVTLTAADLTNTVVAGLYPPSLPASSQTDASVTMAVRSLSSAPAFVDPTRTVATWDASLGGAGTEGGAFARLVVDPTLVSTSLRPYILAGFLPTTAAYRGAGYLGADLGAVPFAGGGNNATLAAIRHLQRRHRERLRNFLT